MKLCTWCTVSQHRVIGPVFFEEIVNAKHYHGILKHLKIDTWCMVSQGRVTDSIFFEDPLMQNIIMES
jgi:hypothetical protein